MTREERHEQTSAVGPHPPQPALSAEPRGRDSSPGRGDGAVASQQQQLGHNGSTHALALNYGAPAAPFHHSHQDQGRESEQGPTVGCI